MGVDYQWDVDPNTGVMTLTDIDDLNDITTVLRQGSSSRSIGFTFLGSDTPYPEAGTLLIPIIVTALDLTGGSSRAYDVSAPSGVARLTFDADGTFDILDSDQSTDSGVWLIRSSGALLTLLIDGSDEIISAVLINGDFATGGTLVVAVGVIDDPWTIWEDLFDAPIVPVQF